MVGPVVVVVKHQNGHFTQSVNELSTEFAWLSCRNPTIQRFIYFLSTFIHTFSRCLETCCWFSCLFVFDICIFSRRCFTHMTLIPSDFHVFVQHIRICVWKFSFQFIFFQKKKYTHTHIFPDNFLLFECIYWNPESMLYVGFVVLSRPNYAKRNWALFGK